MKDMDRELRLSLPCVHRAVRIGRRVVQAFARTDEDGSTYTAADIERRARIDRLFEITQQKGNSECQIGVGMADEDCNFENTWPVCDDGEGTQCASEPSFLRNALLTGLAMGKEGGQNPYKLGVIGSTDTHLSDPGNTAREIPAQFSGIDFSFAVKRHEPMPPRAREKPIQGRTAKLLA